ncbi:hypothetical protein [Methylomonas sp. AM2-LC]|uniref:hypothetical protein n=1 Tax=Methylomonas sp. AM2-LC TaxID=3153301 RepID=UPI003265CD64
MKKLLLIANIGLLSLSASTQAADISACKAGGINLDSFSYFSSDRAFIDLAKVAGNWISPENRALQLDKDGYPISFDPTGRAPESLVTYDNWKSDPQLDDKYVLLYDGEGQLKTGLPADKILQEGPGRILFKPYMNNLYLDIIKTNPDNHIRNLRLIPSDFEKNYVEHPFRERYLKTWGMFPVWRFMDFMATNDSLVTTWQTRKQTTAYGADGGVPIEDIINLANKAQVAPWLNIPHMATDDYIVNLASYVKEHLDPKLKVYIEYSNEAWNGGFKQFGYMVNEGKKHGMDPHQFYADRALSIFKAWEQVFGGADRIVRVVGTQATVPWVSERIFSWKDIAKHTDALAVGYYFGYEYGSELVEKTVNMTVDQLVDDVKLNALAKQKQFLIAQKAIADKYKISLVSYEAGQHLVGAGFNQALGYLPDNVKLADLFIAANRHPKMNEIYKQHYQNWVDVGGGMIGWFSSTFIPGKWGSWGLLESGGQKIETAPKFMAVKDIQTQLDKKSIDACKYVSTP